MWQFLCKKQRYNRDLDVLHQDIETNVHIQSIEDLLQSLQVDPEQGLSTIEAKNRLRDEGPNVLTPPKKRFSDKVLKILHLFCGGFSLLTWVTIFERFKLPMQPLMQTRISKIKLK